MDCGSSAHRKGGTAFYEQGRGQLSVYTEPHVRQISCHVARTTRRTEQPLPMKVSDSDRNVKINKVWL